MSGGWKETTSVSEGTSAKYGGKNTKEIMQILNGLTVLGKTAPLGKQHIPLSTIIGDYLQSIVSASPSSPVDTVLQNNSGTDWDMYGGLRKRVGQTFVSGAAEIGNTLQEVSFWLSKTGSPTGTITFLVRDSGDTIVHTFGTLDSTTLTGTETKFTENAGDYILQAGDRVLVEYDSGDASNFITLHARNSNDYDGGFSYLSHYFSSWVNLTSEDTRFEMKFIRLAVDVDDGDTGTVWTTDSEVNPQVVLNLGSLQEVAAIAIYRDASDTTTEITIEVSLDDVTYTLLRTIDVSFITTGQYTYVLFNRPLEKMQYIKIKGTDGSAKVMSYAEIKVRTETESITNRLHEHSTISTTDILLKPNGDP